MLPPELVVTIRRIGAEERNEYEVTLTRADTNTEIGVNTFTYDPDTLLDLEPQWMLDKAVPRTMDDAVLKGEKTAAEWQDAQEAKLAAYGQRLYSFLFGDGQALGGFLKYNDVYAQAAHLTLALHSNASALWRLPWEYIHDGQTFLALHGKFQLSRRPQELGALDRDPVQLPLRLLVIISAPDDQANLDTEEEISVIQTALDDAQRAGLIQVEFLDDATLEAIGAALKEFNPHVLHYTGHGSYSPLRAQSFLALESEAGDTRPAAIEHLRPHLHQAPALRLAVLSGCQTAQTSDNNAFSGVATGMLQADIPAVLAMQFSILDNSGIKLAQAFYSALARGESLAAAMQAARVALWQFEEGPGYDWGVPALYLRTRGLVLVDPTQSSQNLTGLPDLSSLSLINIGGLPLPPHFVGRKRELRQLRRALADNQTKSAFVRGIGGMGKSSLAAKLAQRPGVKLDGVLVIRCHEVDVLDLPGKLAAFLQGQGLPGHAEAGRLLLDSTQEPTARAQAAAKLVADRRYLLVFDNFESVLDAPPALGAAAAPAAAAPNTAAYAVADPTLAGLLAGLLRANWRSLCLFTGRDRWQGYDECVAQDVGLEIHLPELTAPQAIMLMNNLSRLRREKQSVKVAMFKKVGGHPKTIELLNGWLKQGNITNLLDDKQLDGLLTAQWEEYFLRRLLARLSDDERNRLTHLAIFQTRLGADELAHAGVDDVTAQRWLDLSLLQREQGAGGSLWLVHPVVAQYLLAQTTPAARTELHRWAAAFYGQPFVEMARAYAAQSGQSWSEEQIEWFARDADGVVGQLVAQTQDMDRARSAMTQALEWQHHLFAVGAVDAADDIVNAVHQVLARWGERDRAKGLLRRSIASLEGGNKPVAQANLATLLKDEGKLAEALATYEAVYETFAALNAKPQMAVNLGEIGNVYLLQGKLDQAIKLQERKLEMVEELGDEIRKAVTLHMISVLYHMKEEHKTALARSRAAETLARKVRNEALTAVILYQQGLIYNKMARATAADEKGTEALAAHTQTATARFQESLTISRRIDNEAGAAKTLIELGKLLRDAGQMGQAIAYFNEALATHRKLGDPVNSAIVIEALGVIHEDQGQDAAALDKFQEALALFQQYAPHDVARTQRNIARVQAKLGQG